MSSPINLQTRIEELEAENYKLNQTLKDYSNSLKAVRKKLEGPSLKKMLATRYNQIELIANNPELSDHPLLNIPQKLRIYEFAASHGIQTPKIFGSYRRLNDIDLASLPDRFVLKSDGGASSEGVLPLVRTAPNRYQRVDGHREYSASEVIDFFSVAQQKGLAYGDFFAEELLEQLGGNPIPDDIKIYTTYSGVTHVHLRRVDEHGVVNGSRNRYLDKEKNDLGNINPLHHIDPSIPIPENFDELCEISLHLARAIGLPFIRIDLYNTTQGIVLGEITRGPGPASMYTAEFDEELGKEWLRAEARQMVDFVHGRPAGHLWGRTNYLDLYPSDSIQSRHHRREKTINCSVWCKEK